jgi:ABC-type transport system involved in Fe-S cluster assembly fused permease/ATPase subunit
MAIEFTFLCGALYYSCGLRYLINMLVTLVVYTSYTNFVSSKRIALMKDKMKIDKRQEFFQNESIMNYETVKQFNNEDLEISRYDLILKNMTKKALQV